MAVEIKYVVVRRGEEKMTFASKKEADAYDKMLDMAEAFCDWLGDAPLEMNESQREALGLFLAERKDDVQHIVRTSRAPEHPSDRPRADQPDENASKSDRTEASPVEKEAEPEAGEASVKASDDRPAKAKSGAGRAAKAA
ncbi:YebG family protein [Erwinia oleae]|uniref:YebG family protein n=1 Tax=Erwinia oleae TaxID=796334 RepID=UPI0005520F22|nr:YebG family protein [Erwinia oleae]